MSNPTIDPATKIVLERLIAEVVDQLNQARINAVAASELAKRGKTSAALRSLMEVEPPAHDALDLFRAAMTLRTHVLVEAPPPTRRK